MEQPFEIGDVVVLRSGGPYMTVNDINEDRQLLECIWFNEEDEKELDHFRPEVLDEVKQDDEDDTPYALSEKDSEEEVDDDDSEVDVKIQNEKKKK